jgi:hypothetical protein
MNVNCAFFEIIFGHYVFGNKLQPNAIIVICAFVDKIKSKNYLEEKSKNDNYVHFLF